MMYVATYIQSSYSTWVDIKGTILGLSMRSGCVHLAYCSAGTAEVTQNRTSVPAQCHKLPQYGQLFKPFIVSILQEQGKNCNELNKANFTCADLRANMLWGPSGWWTGPLQLRKAAGGSYTVLFHQPATTWVQDPQISSSLQHTPLWISPCTILRAGRSSLCFCCQETNSGGIWCLLHLSSLLFVWNTLSQVTVPQLLLAPICLRAIGPGLTTVLVLFLFVCLNLFIFLSSHWVSQLQTHSMSRSTSLPYAAFPGSIQPTMCLTLCAKHYKIRIFIWKYWVNSCFTYRQMSVCKLMETLPSCFTGDRINTQLTQSLD